MNNAYTFTSVITSIVSIASMPVECVCDMEEQDMYADRLQWELDSIDQAGFTAEELHAVLGVAKQFHYNTKGIELAIAKAERKAVQSAQFQHDFEMALAERKEREMQNLEVLTAVFKAEQKNALIKMEEALRVFSLAA